MLPNQATQQAHGRVGNYIHTAPFGRKYFPFDPRPEEIDIEMIAHHLATEARFGGATQHPEFEDRLMESVSEHSVLCSWYVEDQGQPEYALEALLHDAPEGPIGDMIRPLKYSPELREPFKKVEDKNEICVAAAFNLAHPFPAIIKIADEAVCTAEIQQIVPRDPSLEWESGRMHDNSRVAPYKIHMLPPFDAKRLFMKRFKELVTVREKYRELPARWHRYKLPTDAVSIPTARELYKTYATH